MGDPTPLEFPQHHHAVKFYSDQASLCATVAGFLSEGLNAGEPALVIATRPHSEAICAHLSGRSIDCPNALKDGSLILLDADEMLSLVMVDGMPDAGLFERNIGVFIQQLLAERPIVIRAYGEMVDVLWKSHMPDAAIALELLWNKLALKYRFALLCGYAMGNFYKQSKQMVDVCAQHSHVVEGDVVPFRRTA
jgi:hypothetical protein